MKTPMRILLTAVCLTLSLNIFGQSRKHTVQQGETVYAIARKYSVSANEILRLNPILGNGDKIVPGQVLSIPNESKVNNQNNGNVQAPPQTTRTYDATTRATTQVQSNNGYSIDIPQRTVQNTQQVQNAQQGYLNSGCKEMYRIQKRDNLYRIALNYNLTIEEIVEANPGLTAESKLKKGELLCIPYSRAEKQAEINRIAAEQARIAAEQAAKRNSHKKHLNIAVILPVKENSDRGVKMLEFYRGLLMAADSVKRQGTSVDVYAYHSGSSLTDMASVVNKPELKKMDVIFGPLDGVQAVTLSEFCRSNKVRLVMPFATTNSYGLNNPYVYQASSTSETARKNGADMVAGHFSNCNYVIFDTGASDDRGARFTDELKKQLSARGSSMKYLSQDADEYGYTTVLNKFRDNLIVPNGSSLTAASNMQKKLRNFIQNHPEYKISILGYPEWPTYTSTLLADFHTTDTYAYCTFFRHPYETRVSQFEARFRNHYKKEVAHTFPRYGIYGFDLGYYFMHGLAELGDYFEEKQGELTYKPYQNAFRFEQRNENSAFTNQQIFLVHYAANQRIEVIK